MERRHQRLQPLRRAQVGLVLAAGGSWRACGRRGIWVTCQASRSRSTCHALPFIRLLAHAAIAGLQATSVALRKCFVAIRDE